MKRIFSLLLLGSCFAAFTLTAGALLPTEKHAPRSIRIGQKPAFTLTAKNCTVVVAPDAPKTTRFAAAELHYSTGINIVNEPVKNRLPLHF